MSNISSDLLQHEEVVIWLEDPSSLRYVREEYNDFFRSRTRRVPYYGPGRLVGYGVLHKKAPNSHGPGLFGRRFFWVRDNDGDVPGGPYNGGTCPVEGVDPKSVVPGVPGQQNVRAWGLESLARQSLRELIEWRKHNPRPDCAICGNTRRVFCGDHEAYIPCECDYE